MEGAGLFVLRFLPYNDHFEGTIPLVGIMARDVPIGAANDIPKLTFVNLPPEIVTSWDALTV